MVIPFTRLSYWIWGRKDPKTPNSSLSSSPDLPSVLREMDSVKFPPVNGPSMPSSLRKKTEMRKRRRREERRIDKEYDIVLVPSDGGGWTSGTDTDSDDSDWSIGWLEPHAPGFHGETETEDSFAVLVPCYGRGRCEHGESSNTQVLGLNILRDDRLPEGKKIIDEWLSSLQS
ncbi:uncharacterized protein [Typha latifolia]|uniref:uncharacterized protein n=1 Tax=Typha latifolia TaxID=4733 RepID=UPI003C2BAD29